MSVPKTKGFFGSCSNRLTQACQLPFKANFEIRSLACAPAHVMIIEMYYIEKCITGSNTVFALCIFALMHAHSFSPKSTVCWDINCVLLASSCWVATVCGCLPIAVSCHPSGSHSLCQVNRDNYLRWMEYDLLIFMSLFKYIQGQGAKHATPWISGVPNVRRKSSRSC